MTASRRLLISALTVGLALAGLSSASTASAAPGPTVSVLATGLNIPKYLTVDPRGGVDVAESGVGGAQCVDLVGISGAPTQACTGPTGRIDHVDAAGHVHPVMTGLASTVEKDNGEVEGPIAVANDHGHLFALERGAFVGPTGRSTIPGRYGREFGQLLTDGRCPRSVADFPQFAAHHPQPAGTLGGLPGETTYDSDVHDLVPYRGGYAFADAGANDVLWRSPSGTLALIARLPTVTETAPAGALGPGSPALVIQAQAVPSAVTVGPDGALYVTAQRGLPGLPGTSSVYRVVPGAAPVQVVAGLDRASDLAFDHQGRLLILEARVGGTPAPPTAPGALLRTTLVRGAVVHATPLPVTGLSAPTGLAIGRDDVVYVTNQTHTPGQGQILRISGLG